MKTATAIGLGAGALIIGGVFVWKFWDKLKNFNKDTPYENTGIVGTLGNATNQALGGLPQTVGEAIGSGLFSAFHGDDSGESMFYTTTFPDGARHAVPASSVDGGGVFSYSGQRYQLVNDKDGKHFAVRT